MRKIIKIGFPILCVTIITGTFILLNKTADRINKNKLVENDLNVENQEIEDDSNEDNFIEENTVVFDTEESKIQEVKNKAQAIEIVKKLSPPITDVYYTNEGVDGDNYIVAIRDNKTKSVKIYYSVDIKNEKIEIFEK